MTPSEVAIKIAVLKRFKNVYVDYTLIYTENPNRQRNRATRITRYFYMYKKIHLLQESYYKLLATSKILQPMSRACISRPGVTTGCRPSITARCRSSIAAAAAHPLGHTAPWRSAPRSTYTTYISCYYSFYASSGPSPSASSLPSFADDTASIPASPARIAHRVGRKDHSGIHAFRRRRRRDPPQRGRYPSRNRHRRRRRTTRSRRTRRRGRTSLWSGRRLDQRGVRGPCIRRPRWRGGGKMRWFHRSKRSDTSVVRLASLPCQRWAEGDGFARLTIRPINIRREHCN